ncbi:2-amino-4-hydroxy-6-hydroxymethyldihydropteridine diphosphokinase [Sphingomonas endophytica]|uniref:2-amino-4-hydroxy-6-hydroxymethyldihydropteridine pyrophosphokinase n=1 Tax=Sphingomonas endophytica TaxID=869719 RepID=A0A7X0MPN9_9SPHN|nr:2-amino-4-hydroxy-6-hydroxymethyldihydropteridine diphosphokinase [Sphingomonas endophytica]MBB6506674.1 2-amino-4-hydroxy-6-hydroxymethyldihydropteridine diphosphokinase [Sphingomonas endophytica]
MPASIFLVALGSNRCGRHGRPRDEVAAALRLLGGHAAPIVASAPLGPSTRTFANSAVLIATDETPPALLARLKTIERAFRRRRGRRWGARVIDLDIILWSGGAWRSPTLTIPHPAFQARAFVLGPAAAIAPDWRAPGSALTLRQRHARLTRARAAPNRLRSA